MTRLCWDCTYKNRQPGINDGFQASVLRGMEDLVANSVNATFLKLKPRFGQNVVRIVDVEGHKTLLIPHEVASSADFLNAIMDQHFIQTYTHEFAAVDVTARVRVLQFSRGAQAQGHVATFPDCNAGSLALAY